MIRTKKQEKDKYIRLKDEYVKVRGWFVFGSIFNDFMIPIITLNHFEVDPERRFALTDAYTGFSLVKGENQKEVMSKAVDLYNEKGEAQIKERIFKLSNLSEDEFLVSPWVQEANKNELESYRWMLNRKENKDSLHINKQPLPGSTRLYYKLELEK
jgi:hypothetical protein